MKKFERLPSWQRKEEIQTAALQLFKEKGFAATTMENIVQNVSLSKGGVYRIYPSTIAILNDLMITGMHLRNTYYEECVQKETAAGRPLTLPFLIEMISDSLLLYPDFSSIYVEFLWEKQRRPELETLYQKICAVTVEETTALIRKYEADSLLLDREDLLEQLTELMNAAILSLHTLNLYDCFKERKEKICAAISLILS